MPVVIVQALCPSRHCILAVSGEGKPDELTPLLREAVEMAIATKCLNPWCGLCGAPAATWTYEAGVSKYASMEEAAPELARLAAEQEATRNAMMASGRAYDAQRGKC
jgi:hypothetical protein